MEFTFETEYTQKALTVLTKTLRKTVRRKKNRCSHIVGWLIIALGVFVTIPFGKENYTISFNIILTWGAMAVILLTFAFEDSLNAHIARKRLLAGTERSTVVFREDGYHSVTELGNTEWHYDKIFLIADTKEYFVFAFDISHAQVYDKSKLSGGTAEEFARFIAEKTGKEVRKVKW